MNPALVLATFALAAAPADPLAAAHDRHEPGHVLVVTRVDSAIENLNKGTVDVFSTRREYRCPTGEMVAESNCNPCTFRIEEWGQRPPNLWMYESAWGNDEASHRDAVARLTHFQKYFELGHITGSDRTARHFSYFEHTGRLKPPPAPASATRVRFFVGGKEATAALIPYGSGEVEVEARAQARNDSGELADFAEAELTFTASCGNVHVVKPGLARLSLPSGVERCEFKAVAEPGGASERIGVRRELTLDVTYEGQAADEIVLEGTDAVELGWWGEASGKKVAIDAEWKAEGGTLEIAKGGEKVKFRLAKGSQQGSVELLDKRSGAADRINVRRKK